MFKRKALGQALSCKVFHLVPDEEFIISYDPSSLGQSIFDDVCSRIDLHDRDYYGLKFKDQIQWLDLNKTIAKQVKSALQPNQHLEFELRFKFYPGDQATLQNEITSYYLYLQLRIDLTDGRLHCDSQETLSYLIACILQCELGDYVADSDATTDNYVSQFRFVPNQTEELELASIALHKSEDFQGLSITESERNFLKKACKLDRYGIDPYPVKEGDSQNHYIIGVNHRGISLFQGLQRTRELLWDEIEKITFDGKLVLIYCRKQDKKSNKSRNSSPLYGFRCVSKANAYNFWKIAIEHRYFFTLEETPHRPLVASTGSFFKKNYKLTCFGKVERDVVKQNMENQRPTSSMKRTHSLLIRTNEGKNRWRGFRPGGNLETSLSNVFTDDNFANTTLPADLERVAEGNESDDSENNFASLASNKQQLDNLSGSKSASQPIRPHTRRSIVANYQSNDVLLANYQSKPMSSSDLVKTNLFFVFVVACMAILIYLMLNSDLNRREIKTKIFNPVKIFFTNLFAKNID